MEERVTSRGQGERALTSAQEKIERVELHAFGDGVTTECVQQCMQL